MHTVKDDVREQMTPETMQGFMERVNALEAEMGDSGAFVFTGGLHGPDAATVVRKSDDGGMVLPDGPFVESKEHLGGFYFIEADDLDAALASTPGTLTDMALASLCDVVSRPCLRKAQGGDARSDRVAGPTASLRALGAVRLCPHRGTC